MELPIGIIPSVEIVIGTVTTSPWLHTCFISSASGRYCRLFPYVSSVCIWDGGVYQICSFGVFIYQSDIWSTVCYCVICEHIEYICSSEDLSDPFYILSPVCVCMVEATLSGRHGIATRTVPTDLGV